MPELLIVAQQADPTSTSPPSTGSIWVFVLMLVAMWAILYLPRRLAKKRQDEMLSLLKVGDAVVTIGGLFGRVVFIEDDSVTLEIEEGRIRIAKRAIATVRGEVS